MLRLSKRQSVIILAILVFIISLFVFYPPIYRSHIRRVLDRYNRVRIGMYESEVIGLLGSPRIKARIRTSELGDEMLTWNITNEMIEELKKKHIWLLKYSYRMPATCLSLGFDLHQRKGLDIYINENDSTVVLIRRISEPRLEDVMRQPTSRMVGLLTVFLSIPV